MKPSIRELRRSELTQAAFDVLVVSGARGTTFERVAARAGVSKGIILHHFKDKNELFEAVIRKATAVLRDGVVELLKHAQTPMERLYAVLVGNFAEPVFREQVCNSWLSLCAEAPYNAQNQRIQRIIHARLDRNLHSALKFIVPRSEVNIVVVHLRTAIDGIWLRASLKLAPVSLRGAMDQMNFIIEKILDGNSKHISEAQKAHEKMERLAGIILRSNAFSMKALVSA